MFSGQGYNPDISVHSSSAPYSGFYPAEAVLSNECDMHTTGGANYYVGQAGATNGFIILDMGGLAFLKSIAIKNTHNANDHK